MNLTYFPLREYTGLLQGLGQLAAPVPGGLDLERTVKLVSYNSREVVPGTLFLCKGAHFRQDYLADALRRGAFAYVSERAYPEVDLPCVLVRDMRQVLAPLAVKYYNNPAEKLKVIGVTGTKGKSSTSFYLKHILDELLAPQGKSCGLITSIETWDGVERFESKLTTPEPLELQKHLANAAASGMEYVVMEASSQALKYHRTMGVRLTAAAFLNIGVDHISPIEHPDFEDYFHSKLKIFAQADCSCVNMDCDHAQEAVETAYNTCGTVFTFSRHNPAAAVYASGVRKVGHSTLFQVDAGHLSGQYRLTMPGLFNVDNALAAIAVCRGLDIPKQAVVDGLARARVPGRMEVYASADDSVVVIVDFAHNQMSFENLMRTARAEYPGRRVVAVFGSVGDKAYDRRQGLGETGGRYADLSVLTEDDSGEEDTRSICEEIGGHVAAQGGAYTIQVNRGEAIRQAILGCKEPSLVLLVGRGVESRQKRGQEYIDTPTDVEYAQAFLREWDARHAPQGTGA